MAGTTIIKNDNDKFERAPVNSKRLARDINVSTDVEVPMRTAFVTVGFVFTGFIGFALFQELELTLSYVGLALLVSIIAGFIAFILKQNWLTSVLYSIETVVGSDMDHDGFIGEPAHPVKININNSNPKQNPSVVWQKRFEEFIHYIYLNGTEHHLCRKAFNEREIVAFRQYGIDTGILRWKNSKQHNLGIEFVVDEFQAQDILDKTEWIDIDRKTKMR